VARVTYPSLGGGVDADEDDVSLGHPLLDIDAEEQVLASALHDLERGRIGRSTGWDPGQIQPLRHFLVH